MNSKAEKDTKINEAYSQLAGLKEKVKELCKLSQEKHVLRMVLARSKETTQTRMFKSSKNFQYSNFQNKKVLDNSLLSDETANQKKQKIISLKMRSAPREAINVERPPPSCLKSHKVKSQGFILKSDPSKLISTQQKSNIPKKTALFSSSTPRNNFKTKHDFQNISSIKECKTNSLLTGKNKTDENNLNSKVTKVPENPVKITLQKKASKSHTIISNGSKSDLEISEKGDAGKYQKLNKTTQEIGKKSPITKIPKVTTVPPIKKTKSALRTKELSSKREIIERQKSCFNTSYLTSYELALRENGKIMKNNETSEAEDTSCALYETCDNTFFDKINSSKTKTKREENSSSNLEVISRKSHIKEILKDCSSEEMANKVQKYSEWRRISSSYPSPVPDTKHESFGIIEQELQSELTDQLTSSPNISASKYVTAPSFIMDEDSDINLSVDDFSIEQVDAFKVNNADNIREKESFDTNMPTNLANRSRVGLKKSPKNKKNLGKSLSERNKVLTQYQEACRSQTWISFAKLFAENVKKAREQKKLREMGIEKPFLYIADDAEYLPNNVD